LIIHGINTSSKLNESILVLANLLKSPTYTFDVE